MIMYTSGTTARPKGVMYSHGNITTLGHTLAKYLGWTREDVYLHHFPLYHGNGGLMGVAPAIWTGATLAMIPKFSASSFGHQLVEYGATFTAVNATHVKMILNNPVTAYDSAHAVRRMILGMTLTPEQIVDFETRFRTRLFGTYGLTETLTAMVVGEPSGLGPHAAAGRVARGYSLRVVDENEEILPAGTVGEALIFSHQRHGLTMGYFKDPVKTREAFVDGWLHTGDFVRVDEGGYVWYEGRKKDMIKRSGFNVAPAEVERVIQEIAGVSEVAVVGCPDDMREEAIVAFVVADTQMFEADVIVVCAKQLAHYKVPQVVEFLEALPENFLGKVDRNELRVRALKYRVDSTNRP
jgi:crotonobetaine/carnitine-CoA ligase